MNSIDYLTYKSWYYQVHWYGLSIENARKYYKNALIYEQIYQQIRKEGKK